MQAVKLHAHVDRDRKLSLPLPVEVPEGDVEVIVLAPQRGAPGDRRQHLERLLGKLAASARVRLSKDEIDAYLAQERASWERPWAAIPALPLLGDGDGEANEGPQRPGER